MRSIPISFRYPMAAVRPTASAMGGVPASKRAGGGAARKLSSLTSRIMPPPPRKGGMASSSSARPHRTPMPVGPIILWAEKAMKSTPSSRTSTGEWGASCAPSVGIDRDVAQVEAAELLGEDHPRHDVGVVLHFGQEHGVAGPQVRTAPGLGDQGERLRRVLCEHH